jgi:Arc/MetJ-type ribon-helix-helix transcriptional regulator
MVGLMGGSTTEQDVNACLDSDEYKNTSSFIREGIELLLKR